MSEWWTYRPEDFLLFSPRVYWRMFEMHNAQVWPLHLVTFAVGLVLVRMAWRQERPHALWIALVLAALWAFVGWLFLWVRYASINWAIFYVAPAFALEAVLLAITSARFSFARRDTAAQVGLLMAVVGIVLYPLLPLIFGRSWTEAEGFGIAPDPTAVATLGLLLTASGRFPLLLIPVPLVWLLLSGLTLQTMGDPQGWIPFMAAGTTLLLLAIRLARAPRATPARSGRHRR